MSKNIEYDINRLRDYSSLFSRNEIQRWQKGNLYSIQKKADRYDKSKFIGSNKSHLNYLQYVYKALENQYRNEYVVKNSFLNQWLVKELGKSHSKAFNEFRVGNAIADLAMFNGVSKAFEIKTELDSDKRLNLQLENYRKVFNQVYLIVPHSKLELYKKYDSEIGIISFESSNKNHFHLKREAQNFNIIDAVEVMKILHGSEYKKIVINHYGSLPKMTSFNQFDICKELIYKIPNNTLNEYFIESMKDRGSDNALSCRFFKEFNQISLALKMNKVQKKELIDILKLPLYN
jgi:hypothetical protein